MIASPFEESLERHRSSLRAQLNLILPVSLDKEEKDQLSSEIVKSVQNTLIHRPKFISKSTPNLRTVNKLYQIVC